MTTALPLWGQVAVVTGGSGVLGRALVEALAEQGAQVAVCGRTTDSANRAIQTLPAELAALLLPVACDVQDAESLGRARAEIHAALGDIHILINAAGGNIPQASTSPPVGTSPERSFFEVDIQAIRQVMDLNFVGAVQATQILAQDIAQRGSGHIVQIGSMAGIRPLTRVLGYSAAKAALANFTQWLAVHFAEHYGPGVQVNAIAPGFFLTEQNRYLMLDGDQPTPRAQTILAHTPQRRFGKPQDLKAALQWLVSPQNKFVTGLVLPVDGGFSAFSGV